MRLSVGHKGEAGSRPLSVDSCATVRAVAADLLVVDTDQAFGELIRQTLEATGLYRVHSATAAAEALNLAFQYPIRLAIVELEHLDTPAEPWLRSLRLANPRLAVYAIPPAGVVVSADVKVDGVFPKPFYLPDLPRLVSEAVGLPPEAARPVPFGPPQASDERKSEPEPEWLSDAGRAQETLTRAVLPTAARAGALIRSDRLWALTIPADSGLTRNQLAPLISTASDVHTRGSLTRFFRPPAQKEDFVAYITAVSRELALIALFGRETPLGDARRTGENLVHWLLHPMDIPAKPPAIAAPLPPPPRPEPAPAPPRAIRRSIPPPAPRPEPAPAPPRAIAPPIPPPPAPTVEAPREPVAPPVRLPDDWVPSESPPGNSPAWLNRVIDSVSASPPPEPPPLPALSWPEDWMPVRPALPGVEAMVETLTPVSEPEPEPIELPQDWIPEVAMEAAQLPFLEGRPEASAPARLPLPAPIRLSLFTVLLPRFPEHELTGELAERLHAWTTRLCMAWDWTAERVDIQPDRLEVTLVLPPEESPAHAIQELRDGLSERVLRSFPELLPDLPSRRFWASSYLLRAGPPAPPDDVETFIRETRHAQAGPVTG